MRADPTSQLRLIDLQALDTRADQLAHRRGTLPQIAELVDLERQAAVLRDEEVSTRTELSDLEREVARVEGEVRVARERLARDRHLMDAGTVSSAKQLTELQHEIDSLGRRVNDLEDGELEVMERVETLQAQIDDVSGRAEDVRRKATTAVEQRDEEWGSIDAELAVIAADRVHVVTDLAPELLKLYEQVRSQSGGIGAAVLHRGRCEGCHLVLTPADISRIREEPADVVVRCEECRRILIRTAESGL